MTFLTITLLIFGLQEDHGVLITKFMPKDDYIVMIRD